MGSPLQRGGRVKEKPIALRCLKARVLKGGRATWLEGLARDEGQKGIAMGGWSKFQKKQNENQIILSTLIRGAREGICSSPPSLPHGGLGLGTWCGKGAWAARFWAQAKARN